jgi:hypothetical protein
MNTVTPLKNEDGTETVELYGTIVDVTGKDSFTLFKREYKVERKEAVKKSKKAKTVKVDDDAK